MAPTTKLTADEVRNSTETGRKWWGVRLYASHYGQQTYGLPSFLGGVSQDKSKLPLRRWSAAWSQHSEKVDLGLFTSSARAKKALVEFHMKRAKDDA